MKSIPMRSEIRELAAIMFTDIAGYTALMGEDEQRAVRVLERSRHLLNTLIPKFNGRVIEEVGDGTLASFQSGVQAVTCARTIQEALKDDSELRVRIGIHIGDVLVAGNRLIGDAVNIASRIHALAEPGGICFSERVYDDIRNKPELHATLLGERTLKNVNRPLKVYALSPEGTAAAEDQSVHRAEHAGRSAAPATSATLSANQHAAKWTRASWMLAAIIALLVVGYVFLLRKPTERLASSPTAVAVLPFSVSGAKDLGYLAEGMVTLLSTKLDAAGELRQVDPHSLLSFVKREGGGTLDPERARTVAEHFGAGLYVLGNILEVAGRVHLEGSIYEVGKGGVVAQASAEGQPDHIVDLVDELAAQLLAGRLSRPGERLARVGALTTRSFPALKSYLEGERDFRVGRFAEAMEAFRRAIAADRSFALAYYRLACAAAWTSQSELTRSVTTEALRLKDRLSERDRFLLEALSAVTNGHIEEGQRRYRDIVAVYPDDWEAWYWFGGMLAAENPFYGRPVGEARDPLEHALSLDPERFEPLAFAVQFAEADEKWSQLAASIERYLALDSRSDYAMVLRAQRAFQFGDRSSQERMVTELQGATDFALGGAPLVQMLHNAPASRALARLMTAPTRSSAVRATGHIQLAHLALTNGRWNAAQAELTAAEKLDATTGREYRALLSAAPFLSLSKLELEKIRDEVIHWSPSAKPASESEDWFTPHEGLHAEIRLYVLGLLSVRLGDREGAVRTVAELERPTELPKVAAVRRAFAGSLKAQTEYLAGNATEALSTVEQSRLEIAWEAPFRSAFFSRAYERYLHAELLHAVGRDQDAMPWYRSLEESMIYDRAYLAPSHLRRAEIYEKLGDRDKAVFHYSRFLETWKDCDAELRGRVTEAAARLERLKSSK
jgi:class 3 adenylate cyclase/tetratricopeptide (TPR) repeat protein